jgi:hypothetical protein
MGFGFRVADASHASGSFSFLRSGGVLGRRTNECFLKALTVKLDFDRKPCKSRPARR